MNHFELQSESGLATHINRRHSSRNDTPAAQDGSRATPPQVGNAQPSYQVRQAEDYANSLDRIASRLQADENDPSPFESIQAQMGIMTRRRFWEDQAQSHDVAEPHDKTETLLNEFSTHGVPGAPSGFQGVEQTRSAANWHDGFSLTEADLQALASRNIDDVHRLARNYYTGGSVRTDIAKAAYLYHHADIRRVITHRQTKAYVLSSRIRGFTFPTERMAKLSAHAQSRIKAQASYALRFAHKNPRSTALLMGALIVAGSFKAGIIDYKSIQLATALVASTARSSVYTTGRALSNTGTVVIKWPLIGVGKALYHTARISGTVVLAPFRLTRYVVGSASYYTVKAIYHTGAFCGKTAYKTATNPYVLSLAGASGVARFAYLKKYAGWKRSQRISPRQNTKPRSIGAHARRGVNHAERKNIN